MADVARRAGVATSTVSYVVSGSRTVSPETRERVLRAIAETGYEPDTLARALRRSRSETVGLLIPDIRNPTFTAIIDGVESEAQSAGYTLILSDSNEDPESEVAALAALRGRRVDGLVLGLTRQTPPSVIRSLESFKGPVVLVDRVGPWNVDQVSVVNDVPASLLVGHLLELGHRRIAMVAGTPGISTAEDRVAGYRMGLEAAGMGVDERWIVSGGSRRDVARQAVSELMTRAETPSAILAGNNDMAIGTLEALRQLGLRIPADVTVVSLDDLPSGHLLSPPLTAVRQPSSAVGQHAMRLLLRRLKDPDAARRFVRLVPTLEHRESCGCPPGTPLSWPRSSWLPTDVIPDTEMHET